MKGGPMKLTPAQFQQEDEDVWMIDAVPASASRPLRIAVLSEGRRPSAAVISRLESILSKVETLIPLAATLILENYSYDHFKKLGVAEEKLVGDDAEAIARAVTLESIYFFAPEDDGFEMSFRAPWDAYHSFDVEFKGEEAITCSVNG